MESRPIAFRRAQRPDLPRIVSLLAADPLGALREQPTDPLPESYTRAFEAIDGDPNQELLLAVVDDVVAGCLQLTYIPSLTHTGSWRGQVEGVRVAEEQRSAGLGSALLEEAIRRATGRGCALVQLTSDKQRPAAIAFYERLGFEATHEGLKLSLG